MRMNTRYPLNQSPLYKLHSRKKLAELLEVSLQELEDMVANADSLYNRFEKTIIKSGKIKKRFIEHPKPKLRRLQRRLVRLLDRIQPPDYLHSAFRGRSYISNALQHDCNSRVAKIDIKKFFPSAYAGYVYERAHDN